MDRVYVMSSIITFMLSAASINYLDYLTLACVHLIAFFSKRAVNQAQRRSSPNVIVCRLRWEF